LPLPKLTDSQIAWVIQQVAAYIGEQRDIYVHRALPLDANQRAAMQSFFRAAILDSARVLVLSEERVGNPPFYGDLIKIGFSGNSLPDFAHMAAITFVDTVVSHEPFTERFLFHELVHIVQYEKLGLPEFSARYVRGFLSGGFYEAVPLEMNAYELDARFSAGPTKPFSVEAEVQSWIDAGKF
jgi:hypothetical protein